MPNSRPRVSVIVPAWNAATTIERALGSVLEDRSVDLECLVVDDGSTDATAEVAERVAAADPSVIVLRQPDNAGVSAARNVALDRARGDWLTFLDADDRLLPGGLAALVAAGDRADALAVIGQRISSDGQRTWFPRLYEMPDIREPGRKSIATNPGLLYYVGPVGKLYRRELADGLRFEGRVLGDQPWVVRALLRAGDRIEVIDRVVYEWRRPRDAGDAQTLTSSRRGSIPLGLEAVHMAGIAYRAGSAAFEEHLAPDARRRVAATYYERLIRADLAPQVADAIARRDPGIGELFEALDGFARSVPADVAHATPALATAVVLPGARAHDWLPSAAVSSLVPLARTAREARAAFGPTGGLTARGALWLLTTLPPRVGLPLAAAVTGVRRRLGALRPRGRHR